MNDHQHNVSPDAVRSIVAQVCPTESAVLGPLKVDQVIAGHSFQRTDGGRNLDLASAIGLVASVATLAQITMASIAWIRSRSPDQPNSPQIDPDIVRQAVLDAIAESRDLQSSTATAISKMDAIIEASLDTDAHE